MRKSLLTLALLSTVALNAHAQQLLDPCQLLAKTAKPISTATTITLLFTGAPSRKNYICSLALVSPDAEKLSIIEGNGLNCATTPITLAGGPTAASGMSLAANGVLPIGNGSTTVAAGSSTNTNVCLL